MTNDEIVARGEIAGRLLGDQSLMSFFTEMKGDMRDAIFFTQPHENDLRERLYHQLRGVDEVLNIMLTYRSAADAILNPQPKEEENQ